MWPLQLAILDMTSLAETQHQHQLPAKHLFCDISPCSTLAMLQRLHRQQKAIIEYMCNYETGHLLHSINGSVHFGAFEEALKIVSCDKLVNSNTIPLPIFFLESTLWGLIDWRNGSRKQRRTCCSFRGWSSGREEEEWGRLQGGTFPKHKTLW